jgi:hypothetical protein
MAIRVTGWFRDGLPEHPETKPCEYESFDITINGDSAVPAMVDTNALELILGGGEPVVVMGIEITPAMKGDMCCTGKPTNDL